LSLKLTQAATNDYPRATNRIGNFTARESPLRQQLVILCRHYPITRLGYCNTQWRDSRAKKTAMKNFVQAMIFIVLFFAAHIVAI
jgi:hypothetical protein